MKYLQHSTHDDSVSNAVKFLQPIDYDNVDIPFSSVLFIELHYDSKCLAIKKDYSCFTVKVYYNNVPFKFATCLEANLKRGSHSDTCSFEDFIGHYDKIKFSGNIDEACL